MISISPWNLIDCDTGHPFILIISTVTITPVAVRLAGELSLPVFTTQVCRGWDSNTQPSTCEVNAITDCATAAECEDEPNATVSNCAWDFNYKSMSHFKKLEVNF